jgi:hypothetical protein
MSGPTWRQALEQSGIWFFSMATVTAATTSSVHLVFFRVGVVLIEGQFSFLHGLYDLIDLANQKGIIPISSIDQRFVLFSGFPGPGKRGDKIMDFCHGANWRRYQRQLQLGRN